tara:strand:- start:6262 stop:6714 length:453 start_codon:yes stop_codon:yes gene_type:complete
MKNIKVLIVLADFYKDISKNLLKAASTFFINENVSFDYIIVPGALEIPQAIKFYYDSDNNYDGYLALGCIIKGETYHFELVSNESARSLSNLSIKYSIPIGNGILTTYNKKQAIMRSDPLKLNKAKEAAFACIKMIKIKNDITKNLINNN